MMLRLSGLLPDPTLGDQLGYLTHNAVRAWNLMPTSPSALTVRGRKAAASKRVDRKEYQWMAPLVRRKLTRDEIDAQYKAYGAYAACCKEARYPISPEHLSPYQRMQGYMEAFGVRNIDGAAFYHLSIGLIVYYCLRKLKQLDDLCWAYTVAYGNAVPEVVYSYTRTWDTVRSNLEIDVPHAYAYLGYSPFHFADQNDMNSLWVVEVVGTCIDNKDTRRTAAKVPLMMGLPLAGAMLHRLVTGKRVLNGMGGPYDVLGQEQQFNVFLHKLFNTNEQHYGASLCYYMSGMYSFVMQSPLTFAFSMMRTAACMAEVEGCLLGLDTLEWVPTRYTPGHFVSVPMAYHRASSPREAFATILGYSVEATCMSKWATNTVGWNTLMTSAPMTALEIVYGNIMLGVHKRKYDLHGIAARVHWARIMNGIHALLDELLDFACRALRLRDPIPYERLALPNGLLPRYTRFKHNEDVNLSDEDVIADYVLNVLSSNPAFGRVVRGKLANMAANHDRSELLGVVADPLGYLVNESKRLAPCEEVYDNVYGIPHAREDILASWLYGDECRHFRPPVPGLHPSCALVGVGSGSVEERMLGRSLSYSLFIGGRVTVAELESPTFDSLSAAIDVFGWRATEVDHELGIVRVKMPYYSSLRSVHNVELSRAETYMTALRLLNTTTIPWSDWGRRYIE